MPSSSPSVYRRQVGALLLLLLSCLGACASQQGTTQRLPFHVALAPATVVRDESTRNVQGNPTDLKLAFDEQQLMNRLAAAMGQTFIKVTRLTPVPEGSTATANTKAWVGEAQQRGADLLLLPSLRYDTMIQTELNDRFWLNLPLFAVGGPFCWFVADRSYHCYARLDGDVFDVTTAAASKRQGLDSTSRVLHLDRENKETSLSFLQRAEGVGPYLLSLVCPAGLIAPAASGIPEELDTEVVAQLCGDLARSLLDRSNEIQEANLADFFPRNCAVTETGGKRSLTGEFVLRLGNANELGRLRYRSGADGGWQEGEWSPQRRDAAADRKVYPFAIALDGVRSDTLQIQVEQRDQDLTKRTFTFAVAAPHTK